MPDNETFGRRLDTLIKQKKMSRASFAEALSVHENTIGHYVNDKTEPSFETLKRISQYFGVSIGFLVNGEPDRGVHLVSPALLDKVEFPFVSVRARAGFASNQDGLQIKELEETHPVTLHDAKQYPDAVIFEIEGDSMEPRLKSGDKVLAKRVNPENWGIQYNDVYVIEYDATITIKRIKGNNLSDTGRLTLYPDNTSEAGPVTISQDMIRSIWKVVKIVDTKRI